MPRQIDSGDSVDENILETILEKLQLNYKKSEEQRLQYSIEVQKNIRLQKYYIDFFFKLDMFKL